MHKLELAVFDKVYKELMWNPDVLIYIRTNPEVCEMRMKERARECEKNIPLSYIQSVHEKYEKMIETELVKIETKVFIVDGNLNKDVVYEQVKNIVESLTT
jgi:deoxyadenosine/deoxycytidine kinase